MGADWRAQQRRSYWSRALPTSTLHKVREVGGAVNEAPCGGQYALHIVRSGKEAGEGGGPPCGGERMSCCAIIQIIDLRCCCSPSKVDQHHPGARGIPRGQGCILFQVSRQAVGGTTLPPPLNSSAKKKICSEDNGGGFNYTLTEATLLPFIAEMITKQRLRILVYNGLTVVRRFQGKLSSSSPRASLSFRR